ncbi:MAG: cytochrome C biogenesis protein [Candidatus Pelagibacter sp.]|nr:cytochrome C biogenesis protein [Candidatus Pelagibacter sp.]
MILGQIGFLLLVSSLIFSIYLIYLIYFNYKSVSDIISIKIYTFTFLQLITILFSFFFLIFSFVNSDFSLVSVYQNSHTTKPLFYKISGTWGNHEGSLLLWLLVLSLFSFFFLIQSRNDLKKYRLLTILFQNLIIIGFLVFIIKTSNPFLSLYPVPLEGLGLNPILQDPALAIHPPILYLGYVGSSIVFSSALAAMIEKYVNKIWASSIKIWIMISWIFLTIGIMLGSFWAYYELGWGGFWFWDPVENVSLMPWLTLTALLHSIIILEKRETFHSWTLILAIISFTLSMNGTFLVRSGILNSIHTFANDPARGLYILIFLSILAFFSLIIFYLFQPEKKETTRFFLFSRETSILINNWFMIFFLVVVLIGTIYPLILEILNNSKISVGPPFFNILIIPFLIPFLIFMSIGPRMNWINTENKSIIKKKLLHLLLIIIIFSPMFFYFDKKNILSLSIFILGIFLLLSLLNELKEFFIKSKIRNISKIISHLGFAILIISISLNNIFSIEIDTNLKVGDSYKFKKYELVFQNISGKVEKNYNSVIGKFILKDIKNDIIYLNPEIRIYENPPMITSEASIKNNFFYDNYITMSNIQGGEYYNIRFQKKFMMLWIWISALVMAFGGLLRVFKK